MKEPCSPAVEAPAIAAPGRCRDSPTPCARGMIRARAVHAAREAPADSRAGLQCAMSTGTVIESSIVAVTPPQMRRDRRGRL